jgi:hypothetical protein
LLAIKGNLSLIAAFRNPCLCRSFPADKKPVVNILHLSPPFFDGGNFPLQLCYVETQGKFTSDAALKSCISVSRQGVEFLRLPPWADFRVLP